MHNWRVSHDEIHSMPLDELRELAGELERKLEQLADPELKSCCLATLEDVRDELTLRSR